MMILLLETALAGGVAIAALVTIGVSRGLWG
jgi:hypothetical protein